MNPTDSNRAESEQDFERIREENSVRRKDNPDSPASVGRSGHGVLRDDKRDDLPASADDPDDRKASGN